MSLGPTRRFRRLLVALDPAGERALATAADVAVSLKAELTGLFVEDRDLLRLASLPLFEEIALTGAVARRLDRATLKRELKAQARKARAHLGLVAAHRHLRWSFEVRRGQPLQELRGLAVAEDLVSLSASAYGLPTRLGGCFHLGAGLPAFLVLSERDRMAHGPVAVLLDGSPCARQALEIATSLALARRAPLQLWPWSDGRQAALALSEEARRQLPPGLSVGVVPLVAASPAGRLERLLLQHPGLLVVPACLDLNPAQLDQVHRTLACPLLVMAET